MSLVTSQAKAMMNISKTALAIMGIQTKRSHIELPIALRYIGPCFRLERIATG